MQKNNNEEILTQACKLTNLADHLRLVEMPLNYVVLNRDNKDNGAVHYFLNKELDSIQNNIVNIEEQIQEISDVLVDLYNDNDKNEEDELQKSTKNTSLFESLEVENDDVR
ncbi:hypothetical protein [Tetragenococcus halophilus]|uniref:hypothetical protein n=1 Tax=Tetragenococcus halophilus TaxID=51669 RepID=UPI001F1E033B|nr:hypothetical protein [Tetragenococcus halophilus]MCF1601693.1 hypothetical protein [Tetragenococcus halophilus]MDN6268447.1 hypothetical protein [Tetragenococcus koreensis]MDN6736113.1 hypothetical protein [Tetragenococcus koreensis]